ncbi:hypothetical protein VMCG_03089 [Cytospora schulzeri]|uniref:Peptidase metallopeptidase domain-containing protein n=1 Tax=Cytospora schulzeri TaxID=448051 RepID=A0A423WXN1_9PEZI|nr:hypothetical protein VMCG_03089 [Valsa malicola]
MDLPQICTQMPVPPELQATADTLAIQENPLNGHQITAGESILGDDLNRLALPIGTMWRTGRTLRVKILNGSQKIRSKIRHYSSLWTQNANIRLEFVDSGNAEIRVNINSNGSSSSYVGTGNLAIPPDRPTMNFGWLTDSSSETEFSRVITHEFGHALGCIHEHQSPSANIPWNKPAVYDYYQKTQSWSPAQVDVNIFRLYSGLTTQFSSFDTGSIMLYAIPASLTTNGFSTGWNTQLSETDKSFIKAAYPAHPAHQAYQARGFDVAFFNTMEVRHWNKPAKEAIKQQMFPKKFDAPPQMALGLNWLDVANTANVRVRALANKITTESAELHIDTWGDTTLYSAGCTWLTTPASPSSDFQVGQFSTEDDHAWTKPQQKTSRRIGFGRAYSAPPRVVVWLNQLDMARDKNWRASTAATDIDASGFTLHLDAWGDSTLTSAAAAWIAYPADKPGVVSGSYNTQDVRPWDQPQLRTTGRADFPAGAFQGTPTVLIALNKLDVGNANNLRLKLSADSVCKDGMNWHIDSWCDTTLYSAGASYIAFT